MPAVCEIPGLWDSIRTAPYLSREQWRAFNLIILCQLIGKAGTPPVMTQCTVQGLWNQVRGNPPFLSEQEFMATNIDLLCQLLAGGGGGGGAVDVLGGSGVPVGPSPGTARKVYVDDDTGVLYIQAADGSWSLL